MPDRTAAPTRPDRPERPAGPSRRTRGLTLLETLLAGMLLALFAAAIAASVGQGASQLQHDRDVMQAAHALDEVLARAAIVGPANLEQTGPTRGTLRERFDWSLDLDRRPLSDLYDVTATVTWTSRGRSRSASVVTMLYDPATLEARPDWRALEVTP